MRSESGFTLIDLMITISIIGILSSIALPNYQNFIARSRQTEAKLTLSAIYTAETTFFSENNTYTTCISTAGYERPLTNVYYSAGFGTPSSTCGQTGAEDCHVIDHAGGIICPQGVYPAGGYFPSDKAASGTPVNRATMNSVVTTSITRNTFTAGAAGRISLRGAARIDGWTIDQSRRIQNSVSGL